MARRKKATKNRSSPRTSAKLAGYSRAGKGKYVLVYKKGKKLVPGSKKYGSKSALRTAVGKALIK